MGRREYVAGTCISRVFWTTGDYVQVQHWGYFEGPFKGHSPTGEMVEFYGIGVLKVDELLRAEDVEIYYDPSELFAGLLKGPHLSKSTNQHVEVDTEASSVEKCPFSH